MRKKYKKGEIITLDKVKGKLEKICYWIDGTRFIRLKHKDGKKSDHIIMPDLLEIKR